MSIHEQIKIVVENCLLKRKPEEYKGLTRKQNLHLKGLDFCKSYGFWIEKDACDDCDRKQIDLKKLLSLKSKAQTRLDDYGKLR